MSRKYLITFFGGMLVLNFSMFTTDLSWMMRGAFIPIATYFGYLYFYIELRKSFLKPLLNRFYRRAATNEIHMF